MMNEKLEKSLEYQKGVIDLLSKTDKGLFVIDLTNNKFGLTCVNLKDNQYMIFSQIKEGTKDFPKAEDVEENILGIKVFSAEEISIIENWLTVIKANLVAQQAMAKAVPDSAPAAQS